MSILSTLKGELDRRLYWIQMRQETLRLFPDTAKITLSTYRFQKGV